MARTLVRSVSTFFVLDFSAAVAELITALTSSSERGSVSLR